VVTNILTNQEPNTNHIDVITSAPFTIHHLNAIQYGAVTNIGDVKNPINEKGTQKYKYN